MIFTLLFIIDLYLTYMLELEKAHSPVSLTLVIYAEI